MKKYVPQKTVAEKVCDLSLAALAVLAGVYHLLIMMCSYVLDSTLLSSPWLAADRYLVLVFFGWMILYLPVKYFAFPDGKDEITRFLKTLFGDGRLWLALLFAWALIGCLVLSGQDNPSFFSFIQNGKTARYLTENAVRLNDKYLMDLAVSLLVLCPLPALLGKYRKAVCEGIFHLLTAAATLFMITVLIPYFDGRIVTAPGGQIGVNAKGNMQIACNPNTTGAFAALFLMLSLYFITSPRKLFVKILYGLAALIHLFPLALSGSRTALVASACGVAVIGFRWVFGMKKVGSLSNAWRWVISAAAGLCAAGLLILSRYLIRDLYVAVTGFDFVSDKAPGLSGRLKLWGDCLKASFATASNAVFGVTPYFVESAIGIVRNNPDNVLYAHNQFLQVLLSFGLPGLAFFCVWLVKTAVRCVRTGMKSSAYGLSAVVLMLMVANMAESYLTAYFYFCGGMFFLIAGFVTACDADAERAKMQGTKGKHYTKR